MIPKPLRLISLSLLLSFSSEQILLAFPGGERVLFSAPQAQASGEERSGILTHFSSPENPYIALAKCFPKTSSLKQAGWFKKLFKKIKRFFQKIAQAIVKFLQKVVSAITKAFTGMFGQKVGGFLARIVNAPFNFLLNSFYYIQQGDFKGLIKYWGKVALQVALVVFVAIIAPYLLGVLFGFLGAILTGIGSFLGAVGGFLANTVPLLGQVLGGALRVAGNLINFAGQVLSRVGTKLMTQSKQLFKDLREQGLKGIFNQFKDRLLDQINPLRNLQIGTGPRLPDGVKGPFGNLSLSSLLGLSEQTINHQAARATQGFFDSGLGKILKKVGEAISFQWLQNKIDQKIEKSKMNSFWKGILHTLTSVGTQALSAAAIAAGAAILGPAAGALKGAASFLGQGLATIGRAIATGANYLYQGIKTVGSYLYQGAKAIGSFIGQGLQSLGRGIGNAFNATKSFFSNISQKIFGTKQPPINANQIKKIGTNLAIEGPSGIGETLARDGTRRIGDIIELSDGTKVHVEDLVGQFGRGAVVQEAGQIAEIGLDRITSEINVKQIGNLASLNPASLPLQLDQYLQTSVFAGVSTTDLPDAIRRRLDPLLGRSDLSATFLISSDQRIQFEKAGFTGKAVPFGVEQLETRALGISRRELNLREGFALRDSGIVGVDAGKFAVQLNPLVKVALTPFQARTDSLGNVSGGFTIKFVVAEVFNFGLRERIDEQRWANVKNKWNDLQNWLAIFGRRDD